MSYKNKKKTVAPDKRAVSSRFILIVTLLLTVAILLIFLFIFRIISIPDYILNIFSSSGGGGNSNEDGSCEISDIETATNTDIVFEQHYENAYDVLMSLTESNIYKRVIRTIYSKNGETYVSNATITLRGENFRVEYPEKTLVYDGNALYVNSSAYSQTIVGEHTIYNEIGLTSLSYIQENALEADVFYEDPANTKKITVIIRDPNQPLYNEYEVSAESGLVLTERSYYANEVYRAVITDKIEIMDHVPPSDELFIIPET